MTTDSQQVQYHEFSALKQDITDMKSLMSRMVEALSRISVIEERQNQFAATAGEALKRMEYIAQKQHQNDIANAIHVNMAARVDLLEAAVRESHVENERHKARFDTAIWMIRGLWAAVGLGVALLAKTTNII